ncbi:MAG: flagellar basal body protein, partial [Eubacteriales bacterium]|nr:flagellar basal body protein [Eubacteriales bacterium]
MIKGLYIAGTGMLSERSRMDVITNNIANTDTLGYKKDALLTRSFKDMLLERMNDPERGDQTPNVGPLNTGVYADELITSFDAGTPEQTGLTTDL